MFQGKFWYKFDFTYLPKPIPWRKAFRNGNLLILGNITCRYILSCSRALLCELCNIVLGLPKKLDYLRCPKIHLLLCIWKYIILIKYLLIEDPNFESISTILGIDWGQLVFTNRLTFGVKYLYPPARS